MAIIMRLGKVGSGKTLLAVRDLIKFSNGLQTYSNIHTKGIKKMSRLKPEMIIKKNLVSVSKDGTPKYKLTLNEDYWKKKKEGVNIILDEAHTLINSRRSQSQFNIVMLEFFALLRRITGEGKNRNTSGIAVVISQTERKIDVVIREMANLLIYHIAFYNVRCNSCGYVWAESSDSAERYGFCNKCLNHDLYKFNYSIHAYYFNGVLNFNKWEYYGTKSYFKAIVYKNLEKYFKYYDTTQWDSLFSNF